MVIMHEVVSSPKLSSLKIKSPLEWSMIIIPTKTTVFSELTQRKYPEIKV